MSVGKDVLRAYKQTYRMAFKGGGTVTCGICQKPIRYWSDLTVDHILPFSVIGTHERNNLQPAHDICNNRKANKVINELVYETKATEVDK